MELSKEQLVAMGLDENATDEDVIKAFKALNDSKTKIEEEHSKLKTSFDRTSHELAEMKKAGKEKMSEDEQRQAEFAQLVEDNKTLKKEVELSKNKEAFITAGYSPEKASELAQAQLDGDVAKMSKIMKERGEEIAKASKEEALRASKDAKGGDPNGGNAKYTKENFQKGLISMAEMNELREKDPETYNKIIS